MPQQKDKRDPREANRPAVAARQAEAAKLELFRLSVRLREVSDLPNWRPRSVQNKENTNV
jgi:hypothetical protein